jgi:DNA-binding transcriptional MocR family regulator
VPLLQRPPAAARAPRLRLATGRRRLNVVCVPTDGQGMVTDALEQLLEAGAGPR